MYLLIRATGRIRLTASGPVLVQQPICIKQPSLGPGDPEGSTVALGIDAPAGLVPAVLLLLRESGALGRRSAAAGVGVPAAS